MDFASATTAPQHRVPLYAVIVASVLLLSHLSYSLLNAAYQAHLIRTSQFTRSDFYLDYSDVGASIILLLELLLAFLILRSTKISKNDALIVRSSALYVDILIAAVGISLSIVTIPFTPTLFQPFELVRLTVNNLFSPKLLIPLMLVIALPFLAEPVFRAIMLSAWRIKIGTIPAILATSLVFAGCWPLTSAPSAFFIGLSTGLLFTRSGSNFPGIVVNLLATLLCIGVLVWRALTSGHIT